MAIFHVNKMLVLVLVLFITAGCAGMAREADYQFIFQFTNPDNEAKAILYSV